MSHAATLVAGWPNYGTGELVAIGSDGQVYTLPMLEGGKLLATQWIPRCAPLLGSETARALGGKIALFADAIYEWQNRNTARVEILLASPKDIEVMTREMEKHSGQARTFRNSRSELLGIELAPDPGVSEGVLVMVDRNLKYLGAVRTP